MNSIVKFTSEAISGATLNCIIINKKPWFKANDVTKILQHTNTTKALKDHVDDEDRIKYRDLVQQAPSELKVKMDASVSNVNYVNESGLYALIFGSTLPEAKVFKRWVFSEVLPQIRKTGSYSNSYHYWRDKDDLGATPSERWKTVKQLGGGREDGLHYRVVEHIRKRYPDAVINFGGGEHQPTDHARMDAYLKGYTGGQTDITITRGLPNGFQDVLAIELKNPNKKGKLSQKQADYIINLEINCHVPTIISRDYDEVILQVHEHYKEVFARAKPPTPKTYDFSTNENPKYWCNKLKNQTALDEECTKRGIPKDEVRILTKREIASVLITFDKNRKVIP
jgi:prophage antirepressor-like protein